MENINPINILDFSIAMQIRADELFRLASEAELYARFSTENVFILPGTTMDAIGSSFSKRDCIRSFLSGGDDLGRFFSRILYEANRALDQIAQTPIQSPIQNGYDLAQLIRQRAKLLEVSVQENLADNIYVATVEEVEEMSKMF